jgi:hypothetical protein
MMVVHLDRLAHIRELLGTSALNEGVDAEVGEYSSRKKRTTYRKTLKAQPPERKER